MSYPKPPPGYTEEFDLTVPEGCSHPISSGKDAFGAWMESLLDIALNITPPSSLSEWIKRMGATKSTEASEVFGRAARGDVDAQSDILERFVGAATQTGSVDGESLAIIEIWARMLAMHGRPQDKMRLGGVLIYKASAMQFGGNWDGAVTFMDEGKRCLQEAFEQGYEPALTQKAELSRRLAMNIGIPAEVMLGDLAPTVQ